MQIEHWNEAQHGALTEQAMVRRLERRGYRCATWHYAPGTVFPVHAHDCDKIDAVLDGCFRITVDGHDFVMRVGDLLAVPKDTPHSAAVVGDRTVISIDAVRS